MSEHATPGRAIGWGLFCASSWTWVIGMLLPIVMVRDFGWAGFAVFAVPNVLGCAAMGYLVSARASDEATRSHRTAIRWFSIVTVAFQLFVIASLWSGGFPGVMASGPSFDAVPESSPDGTRGPIIAIAVAAVLWLGGMALAALPDRAWPWIAGIAWVISLALLGTLGTDALAAIGSSGVVRMEELVFLAPAIVFGFLLCPYLDGTFHRARQRAGTPHAFGVFGVAFALMLLGTLLYGGTGVAVLSGAVLVHLHVQVLVTVGAHLREIALDGPAADAPARPGGLRWCILPLVGVVIALVPALATETTYLRFLVFYGLVFPTYVLFFMATPARMAPTPIALALFAIVLIVSMPFFDRGFIARDGVFIVPALALVLAVPALLLAIRGRSAARRPAEVALDRG